MKRLRKLLLVASLLLAACAVSAQHYIGYERGDIMCLFGYNPEVQSMKMGLQTYNGITYNVLEYDFADRAQYYYINPTNNGCESFAAIYTKPAVKDSLVRLFDSLYTRVPYPEDTLATAWIEYEDGINYQRVLRDFNPPACLVILAITQKVEN